MKDQQPTANRRNFLGLTAGLLVGACLPQLIAAEPRAELAPVTGIPGAKGFGARSWGGNSPNRLPVELNIITSLEDYGPKDAPIKGTLRYALNQPGPAVILLACSGTLKLKSDLVISEPYKTVAGHLAPQPGVVISHARVSVKTHDIILSDLKIRPGDFETGSKLSNRDCLTVSGRDDSKWGEKDSAENILINRVSCEFSCDEIFSTSGYVRRVTVQNSIFAYALRYTNHPDIDQNKPYDLEDNRKNHHSMGMLIGAQTTEISIIGNLLAFALHRMPRVMPGAEGEIVNNIFYAFGSGPSDKFYYENTKQPLTEETVFRVVGNTWIPLEGTSGSGPIIGLGKNKAPSSRLFFKDNRQSSATDETALAYANASDIFATKDQATQPMDLHLPHKSSELEMHVLGKVGARTSDGKVDSLDGEIIELVKKRKGKILDTVCREAADLNGFTLQKSDYQYPARGSTYKIDMPHNATRGGSGQYSELEKFIWKAANF